MGTACEEPGAATNSCRLPMLVRQLFRNSQGFFRWSSGNPVLALERAKNAPASLCHTLAARFRFASGDSSTGGIDMRQLIEQIPMLLVLLNCQCCRELGPVSWYQSQRAQAGLKV